MFLKVHVISYSLTLALHHYVYKNDVSIKSGIALDLPLCTITLYSAADGVPLQTSLSVTVAPGVYATILSFFSKLSTAESEANTLQIFSCKIFLE